MDAVKQHNIRGAILANASGDDLSDMLKWVSVLFSFASFRFFCIITRIHCREMHVSAVHRMELKTAVASWKSDPSTVGEGPSLTMMIVEMMMFMALATNTIYFFNENGNAIMFCG